MLYSKESALRGVLQSVITSMRSVIVCRRGAGASFFARLEEHDKSFRGRGDYELQIILLNIICIII